LFALLTGFFSYGMENNKFLDRASGNTIRRTSRQVSNKLAAVKDLFKVSIITYFFSYALSLQPNPMLKWLELSGASERKPHQKVFSFASFITYALFNSQEWHRGELRLRTDMGKTRKRSGHWAASLRLRQNYEL
jgi:hypothetical protein